MFTLLNTWHKEATALPEGQIKDPYTKQIVKLSDQQRWAQQPEAAKTNPAAYQLYRYRQPYDTQNTFGYSIGSGIQKHLQNPGSWPNRALNRGMGPGFVAGAIPGALVGGVGAWLANRATKSDSSPLLWALAGALAGGGLGAYSGYARTHTPQSKVASFKLVQDPTSVVMRALADAPGLGFSEKANLIKGVGQLSDGGATQLLRTLQLAGGAGIGATVARFLVGKGLGTTVVGAMLGGVAANALFNQPLRNMGGHLSMGDADFYGNRY